MGQPAAKQGDRIVAIDTHTPVGSPSPVPMPFMGMLSQSLSTDVKIMSLPAAVMGSAGMNIPPHPGVIASNRGSILSGSTSVFINGKPAARNGDTASTCNDAGDLPIGRVVAVGTVNIG